MKRILLCLLLLIGCKSASKAASEDVVMFRRADSCVLVYANSYVGAAMVVIPCPGEVEKKECVE